MNWQNFLNQILAGQAVGTKLFLKKRNRVFNDLVFGVSSEVGFSCILDSRTLHLMSYEDDCSALQL